MCVCLWPYSPPGAAECGGPVSARDVPRGSVAPAPVLALVHLQKDVWKWKQNPDQGRRDPFFGALWHEGASVFTRIFWGNGSVSFPCSPCPEKGAKAFCCVYVIFEQYTRPQSIKEHLIDMRTPSVYTAVCEKPHKAETENHSCDFKSCVRGRMRHVTTSDFPPVWRWAKWASPAVWGQAMVALFIV